MCFSKQIFVYSTKRIFIYHASLGERLFLMSAEWTLVYYSPRGGCLFLIIGKQILIYYMVFGVDLITFHGTDAYFSCSVRKLLVFLVQVLIHDATKQVPISHTLQVSACLYYVLLAPMLMWRVLISYTPEADLYYVSKVMYVPYSRSHVSYPFPSEEVDTVSFIYTYIFRDADLSFFSFGASSTTPSEVE